MLPSPRSWVAAKKLNLIRAPKGCIDRIIVVLGTRMYDPTVYVVFWAPMNLAYSNSILFTVYYVPLMVI